MSLADVERIAVATALVLIFALCVVFVGRIAHAEQRMKDAEHRLTDTERRLTNAERQPIPTSNKRPIGFLAKFESA